jgi:hypothetical protein
LNAVDGTLIKSSNFQYDNVIKDTTFYVEAHYCDSISNRVPVFIKAKLPPVISIVGNINGIDVATLTASGGSYYYWSGGSNTNEATNMFTESGSYNLTMYDNNWCMNDTVLNVFITKYGISQYGKLTNDTTYLVNKYGEINTSTTLNKFGKIKISTPGNGLLQYTFFNGLDITANNDSCFNALTIPDFITSEGTLTGSKLLNWFDWHTLADSGLAVPNAGENFTLTVSGYFIPSETGTYTFAVDGDDGVDIFIDHQFVASFYGQHGLNGLGTHTGSIDLEAGKKHPLRVRFRENNGGEALNVGWKSPSQTSNFLFNANEISTQ